MSGLLLTQNSTFILGPIAKVLGWIINLVFELLTTLAIPNVGLAIILFTVIVYTLLFPLTYKQQKFSKMSAKMNPEVNAIRNKYKGKNDQASMTKMNDETQAVYAKYGTSPTGSCLPTLVQLAVLFALYRVIYAIPAYIERVKAAYYPLVDHIMETEGATAFLKEMKVAAQFSKQDFSLDNTVIDVLNRFSNAEWASLADQFPSLGDIVESTKNALGSMNQFLGLTITASPMASITEAFSDGKYLIIVVAVLIPILAGISQFISVKLMTANTPDMSGGEENQMMNSMKTVNNIMPLMSVFFCLTLPVGVGLYWIISSVVRTIQQLMVNKQLEKMDIDAEIKKNIENYNKKREAKGLPPQKVSNVAKMNTKHVETSSEVSQEEKNEKMKKATEYYNSGNVKPGSIASKALMVQQYNEKNKK